MTEDPFEEELTNAMSLGLSHLPETMFHNLYTPFEVLKGDELLKATEKLARDPRLRTNGQWTLWPSVLDSIRESDLQAFIMKIASVAADFLPPARYHYVFMSQGSPIGMGATHMPRLTLIKQTLDREDVKWSDVLIAWEIQTKGQLKRAFRQLTNHALRIFGSQTDHRYVIGLTLVECELVLWVFDRSGVISSKPVNVHKQPERFLRVILGTLYADEQTLGFDPTIYTKQGSRDKYMTVGGIEYKLKSIYSEHAIKGRGTICYQGEVQVEDVSKFVVIKDSWVDVACNVTESQILWHLNSGPESSVCSPDGVRVIPRMVHHEIVKIKVMNANGVEEEVDDTTAILRGNIFDGDPQFVRLDEIEELGTSTEQKEYEIRAHSRIVMEPYGRGIQMFKSLKGLTRAFCDIFHAIRIVYEKGILHRDISTRNILLQDHNGELRGLLIDFDQAVFISEKSSSEMEDRTGTVPFMAMDRLEALPKIARSFGHDLESMFYVMCWICAMYKGPDNEDRQFEDYYRNRVASWNIGNNGRTSMNDIYHAKRDTVILEEDFETTLEDLAPYFKPLNDCLRVLRGYLFDPPRAHTKKHQLLILGKRDRLEKEREEKEKVGDVAALGVIKEEYNLEFPIFLRPPHLVFQSFEEAMENAILDMGKRRHAGEEVQSSQSKRFRSVIEPRASKQGVSRTKKGQPERMTASVGHSGKKK